MKMTDQEKKQTVIGWRGQVLELMSQLEVVISLYITYHFVGGNDEKKFVDMQVVILGDDRMSLNSKAQVFYFLVTEYNKDWYNSYKSHRPTPKKKSPYSLNSDLIYVIEQRNIFAHRILEDGKLTDIVVPDGVIRFAKFKNSIEGVDYTNEKYQELIVIIAKLLMFIMKEVNRKSTLAPSE